ncbi:phytoene desaturase family protein [Paenibacillus assamensis]|uniref:phytoene desaturase family protein n=1 Tax=Paenibacillus assamensis TaxID=311244 RepID=UPI0004138456|nr:NAD(P)/FAD-dependent oxidoreductase [Paenibacillus assamensis]
MTNKVCILGAGIGGLTAGAYLAQQGFEVTIIEKASTVGGSAGWYNRRGRRFPTGATLLFGLETDGVLMKLLRELHIQLPVERLTHPMDVILPDRTISIWADPQRWRQELKEKFPLSAERVLAFWEELARIGEAVSYVTDSRVALPIQRMVDLGRLPVYALRRPMSMAMLAYYRTKTVEDLMRKHRVDDNDALRQLLNAQLVDAVQTDVSEAALLPASLALTIYRKGSYAVKNGVGTISQCLADHITELGGNIMLRTAVNGVVFDQQKQIWQVASTRQTSEYSIVINNTGIEFAVYSDKQGNRVNQPHASHIGGWGAFRLDMIVDEAIVQQSRFQGKSLPFAFQIVPGIQLSQMLGDEYGPVYATIQTSVNHKGEHVAGEYTLTVSTHTRVNVWTLHSGAAYEAKKEQVAELLLDELERVIAVRPYIRSKDAGTPETYERYIGKRYVGGAPLTVEHAIRQPRSVRTLLPGYFHVGEQVFPGPGTLSSALSGYYAARAVWTSHNP